MVKMTLEETVNTIYISVWQRSTGNIDWLYFTKMNTDLDLEPFCVYGVCVWGGGRQREKAINSIHTGLQLLEMIRDL